MLVEVGRHLKFFDKDGNELNLTRAYGVWYGMLYFPRVSTSLYEAQHIFIVEQVEYQYSLTQSINLDSLPIESKGTLILNIDPDPSDIDQLNNIYFPGQQITVTDSDDANNTFTADVKGFNPTSGSLYVKPVGKSGSGTISEWNISAYVYTFPRGDDNSYFTVKWRENISSDNIFLFSAETTEDYPVIKKFDYLELPLDNGTTDTIQGVTYSGNIPISVDPDATLYRIIQNGSDVDSRVMQLNLALTSEQESRYARTLEVYYTNLEPSANVSRDIFVGTGLNNQQYIIDVADSFNISDYYFNVYVSQPQSGFQLTSGSSATPGSMSIEFSSNISYESSYRLQEGRTVAICRENNPSSIFFCTVISNDYNNSTKKMTVEIEDNDIFGAITDFSGYKILFTDQQLTPLEVVADLTAYKKSDAVVKIKKNNSSELSVIFGNTEYGFTPPPASSIVVEWNFIENLQKVAEIAVYGEVEGEDERFKLILENFGRDIVPSVGPVFRESDVNEALPDYLIVNQKRKELLAAGDEIFPYTGSYKGFINALRFFGYGDLKLKEYWNNIDITSPLYGKYQQVEVPLNLKNINNESLTPNKVWKKTSKFSLTYQINQLTGTFDDFGEPITEDAFQFTNEEILIKLFALKNVLKEYFLPLNARIVDITGEGIYFDTYATESWLTQNQYINSSPDYLDIDFQVTPAVAYIEDQDTPYKKVNPIGEGVSIEELSPYSVSDLANYELSSFFVNKNTSTFLESGAQKIGAKVTCVAKTFNLYWSDLGISWNKLQESEDELPGSQYTWGSSSSGDAYEMEWRINSVDGRTFNYRKRGKIGELTTHEVIIPYEGTYDVELAYYLTSSGVQSKLSRKAFQAKMKSSNLVGFYRASNVVEQWGEIYGNWKDGNWSWGTRNQGVLRPVRPSRKKTRFPKRLKNTTWEQSIIRWSDINSARYFDQDFLDEVENAQISSIDYQNKIIYLYGNYYNAQFTSSPQLKAGEQVIFKGPDSRGESRVKSYSTQNRTIFIEGEYPTSTFANKKLSIISRITQENIIFETFNVDIVDSGYFPSYSTQVDGNVTKNVRSGLGIEFKINGDVQFSQGTVLSSYYDISQDKTTIKFKSLDRKLSNFPISTTQTGGQIINSESGCTLRYFNFSERYTSGNVYSYNGQTSIYLNDINSSLSKLPDPSTNDIIAYWDNVDASISFYVSGVSFDNGYTAVSVEDALDKLSKIDASYSIDFSDFDVDYAAQWAGITAVNKWSGARSMWKNVFSRTWGSFDYHPSYTCGFIINTVAPGGSIRINDGELFEFPNDPYMTMGDALQSLRVSQIEEISKFNYSIAVYNETMGLLRVITDPLSSIWPYYSSIKYEVNDGYFLNDNSSGSSLSTTINFDYDSDISSLPYFSPGNTIKVVKKDNSQTIEVTISDDGAEYDAINSEMIINIDYSASYYAISEYTDYRVFFTPWGEIEDTLEYNSAQGKEIYTPPTYVILATAKVPGVDALGYIEFDGGVTGTYRDFPTRSNTYPVYDFRKYRSPDELGDYSPLEDSNYRAWQEGGFTFPPIKYFDTCNGNLTSLLKSQYGPYINGSFNWNETYIGYDHVDAVTFSTVFFNLANCKISGVVDVIWTLKDSKSGVVLLKTKNPYFVWTFNSPGEYDVEAEILDLNGNNQVIIKKGFVRVFESFETLQLEGCPIT